MIENDLTREPQPFIIIAGARCGGTVLTHALDSHPLVYCARGEPWHNQSKWSQLGLSKGQILTLLLNQTGYWSSGFKVQANQISDTAMSFFQPYKPKVILLSREDIFRQTISLVINKQVRQGTIDFIPQHSFEKVKPHKVVLDKQLVTAQYNILQDISITARTAVRCSGLSCFSLTYEQLVGEEQEITQLPEEVSKLLCLYLGVPERPMEVFLRRINWQPLEDLIVNFSDLEAEVKSKGLIK